MVPGRPEKRDRKYPTFPVPHPLLAPVHDGEGVREVLSWLLRPAGHVVTLLLCSRQNFQVRAWSQRPPPCGVPTDWGPPSNVRPLSHNLFEESGNGSRVPLRYCHEPSCQEPESLCRQKVPHPDFGTNSGALPQATLIYHKFK